MRGQIIAQQAHAVISRAAGSMAAAHRKFGTARARAKKSDQPDRGSVTQGCELGCPAIGVAGASADSGHYAGVYLIV